MTASMKAWEGHSIIESTSIVKEARGKIVPDVCCQLTPLAILYFLERILL
jgi:hypothetical protein